MTALTRLSPRVHPRVAVLLTAALAVVSLTVPLSVILSRAEPGLPALGFAAAAGLAALALSDLRWEGGDTIRLFAVTGVFLALPASVLAVIPPGPVASTRLSGDDRVATAIAVSSHVHETAEAVVVVAADAAADALAAAPLAAAVGGPLLFAGEGLAEEIERLGASRAYLVGEPVDNELLAALLETAGVGTLVPLAGPDPFATSAAVVSHLRSDLVYVASDWTDAIAVVPLPRDGGAVLTVAPDELPPAAAEVLDRLRPQDVVVVGGEASVSAAVHDELAALLPESDVTRLAGADRWATSLAALETDDPRPDEVWLASGTSWSDALAGGLGAAAQGHSLLLVPSDGSTAATVDWLSLQGDDLDQITVVGGDAAVPVHLVDDVTG